jgi:cytochrome c553
MKRALTLLSFGAAVALLSSQTLAAGDPIAGKQKATTCNACHGDISGLDPQYPRLAGQYNEYLQQALHEYKDGRRNNPIMKGFAATLSDGDIADIAAFYASQQGKLDTLEGHIQGD